jgi:zinc/manganese transport system substrate-binding protein
MARVPGRVLVGGLVMALVATFTACGRSARTSSAPGRLSVVAAEDVWGSIARQLGGDHVEVKSLITNPDADPHDYEPTPADARAIASANLVITNGIGYDSWVGRLVAANGVSGRAVVKIGDVVGLKEGDNPHQWYSPASVDKVIADITAQYKRLDPAAAADFDRQRAAFETAGLAPYKMALAGIRSKYAGLPVGASENIFAPMADALGLKLTTPASFLNAVAEGTDPTAADKAAVDRQIVTKAIKVFVFNSQNATPDVRRLIDAARAAGLPVVAVTETPTPRGTTFEEWQTRQLRDLDAALAAGTAT